MFSVDCRFVPDCSGTVTKSQEVIPNKQVNKIKRIKIFFILK